MAKRRDQDIPEVAYSDELRKEIKDADIVLFQGRSPTSRIICWATGSRYSHAGIVARWGECVMVMEAKRAGVVASRLSRIVEDYHGKAELFTATLDSESRLDRDKAVRAAQEELGKHYAPWKLFRIWRRLHPYLVKASAMGPDSYVCSEFVSRSWCEGGVPLTNVEENLATPREIAESDAVRRVGLLVVDPLRDPVNPVVSLRRLFSGIAFGGRRTDR